MAKQVNLRKSMPALAYFSRFSWQLLKEGMAHFGNIFGTDACIDRIGRSLYICIQGIVILHLQR